MAARLGPSSAAASLADLPAELLARALSCLEEDEERWELGSEWHARELRGPWRGSPVTKCAWPAGKRAGVGKTCSSVPPLLAQARLSASSAAPCVPCRLAAMRVCRRWRDIVREEPLLWPTVILQGPAEADYEPEEG